MTFNIPDSEQEVIDRLKTDVQDQLPESNPFFANSFLQALIFGFGGRTFDFYRQLNILLLEIFPDTATGEFLERWGSFRGITRNPATASSGALYATGIDTSVIPNGTTVQSSDGLVYTATSDATISVNVTSVSITRVGTTATSVSSGNHNIASGASVIISGAAETEYNGTFTAIVTSPTVFTYEVTGSPTTPATGTPVVTTTSAILPVVSDTEGALTNQDSGAELTLTSPISGIDSTLIVTFDGLSGGTDIEDDTDFRDRVLEAYQNPVALFNPAAITKQARLVSGVTRVFVRTPDDPIEPQEPGVTKIYFVRDDDVPIIPSAGEVQTVKDSILLIKPAHTSEDDVIVQAPVGISTDFIFDGLSPNTTTMQTAINNNLAQLFTEKASVGVAIQRDTYRAAIATTVDTITGDTVESFSLTTPLDNLTVAPDEILLLGDVTFL